MNDVLKKILIALAIVALILLSVYLGFGIKNKYWNPFHGQFWKGKKSHSPSGSPSGSPSQAPSCAPGSVMINEKGIMVSCGTKEGFVGYAVRPKENSYPSGIPMNAKSFKDVIQCSTTNAAAAGMYCDPDAPFTLFFSKTLFTDLVNGKLPTNMYKGEGIPVDEVLKNPGNYIHANTYETLEEMWNFMHDVYKTLTPERKSELKKGSQDERVLFAVNWNSGRERKVVLEFKKPPTGKVYSFVPGVDIPWGLFIALAGLDAFMSGEWKPLGNVMTKGPLLEKQGEVIARFKNIMNDIDPDSMYASSAPFTSASP